MTEEQFRATLSRSAVKRANWRGLMRNVTAALSSTAEREAKETVTGARRRDGAALQEAGRTGVGEDVDSEDEESG